MSKFEVEIINYFENENSIAELYYESEQWGEISKSKEGVMIKFYSPTVKEYWEFPFEEALMILERARTKLLMRSSKGSFLEECIPDPKLVNEQAEKILEEIVNHPEKKIVHENLHRFGDVIDIYEPKGKGARYSSDGEFIGFLE